MSVIQCPNGHYYDTDKNSSCPWCGVQGLDSEATVRFRGVSDERTVPVGGPQFDATVPLRPHQIGASSPDGVTVAAIKKRSGIDPVVGWLVCIEGPEKGRDYRIHTEKNFIGRSDTMDIALKGDDSISRSNHAVLTYDPRKRRFRISKHEGRGLVYVNGEEIDGRSALSSFDVIEMGDSKFLFVALCSEKFDWEDGKAEM